MPARKVEIIEPKEERKKQQKKVNVCAYARVSTGAAEQKDSFANQQKYYEDKIKANPDYNFVGVFADEAISGTTDKRPNFQRMIRLAENGMIDIIYTKSISRFSRNVVDLLSYCEKLKDYNVNVIFEENGIELLNSSGSLMLTILGAVAQMEVENTSDHVNWTLKNKMEKGELVGQANPLGYDIIDGKLVVNEEEAEIVRFIFKRYLEGEGATTIAKELERMGAKTKKNNSKWHGSTIIGIIKNEKYTGELLQGKTFTTNPIGHKRKENKGDGRFYRVKDNHEAIISVTDWKKAQEIIDNRCISYVDGRKRGTTQNSNQSDFTSKLVCAYCGKNFVRRKTHAGSKYEKIIWKCSSVCKGARSECPKSITLEEDFVKKSVVGMIKNLVEDKNAMFYLSNDQVNKLMKKAEKNKDKLEEQIAKWRKNLELKTNKKNKILTLYLDNKITEEEFDKQRAEIENEIIATKELLNNLESDINFEGRKNTTSLQVRKIISEGNVDEFNKELFDLLVDHIVVGGKTFDENDEYVENPKCLHFELNPYNLSTDLEKSVTDGKIHYKMTKEKEEALKEENIDEIYDNQNMCTPESDNTCGSREPFTANEQHPSESHYSGC